MTASTSVPGDREDLFVADFYPQLGEYLAEQRAIGYDARAGRARFLAWLTAHTDDDDVPAASADPGSADPVRQAITRGMADQARTIRIPVHMVESINKLARVQRQMLQDLGREPTPDELAIELDMTPEKVIEVQQYARGPQDPGENPL
jgi:hypothetical protein